MKTFGLIFVIAVFGILGYSAYKLFIPHDKIALKPWSSSEISRIHLETEVDYDAPVIARDEIFIKAEPWKVFSKIKNVNEWTGWQSSVTAAEMDEGAAPGVKFKWAAGWLRFKSEFHTVKKFDSLGWTGTTPGVSAIHNFRFKEVEGGTKVFVEESLDGLLPLLLSSVFQEELESGMSKSLRELKIASEKS